MHLLGSSPAIEYKVLSVVGAYEYAGGGHKFCAEHFVQHKVRSQCYISIIFVVTSG